MDDTLDVLGTRIRNGFAMKTSEGEEQELFYDLEHNKTRLLQLFDLGPRSNEEAKEVENGKYKHNGKEFEIKTSLRGPILFVAEQLQCSEYYCATLFSKEERRHPNIDVSELTENVVKIFHEERASVLSCLVALFEGPYLPSNPFGGRLHHFTHGLTASMLNLGGGRRGRFPERILQAIDNSLDDSLKISNLLIHATSNTNPSGGQGVAKLGHDILRMRLECLRVERQQLGYFLFLSAGLQHLSGVEITKMAQRLAEKPQDEMLLYILTSTLVALDLPKPAPSQSQSVTPPPLYKDKPFIASFIQLLDDKSQWKSPRLRAVIVLKWSIFAYTSRKHDEEFIEATNLPPGFSDDDVEKQASQAFQSNVFPYLSELTQTARPRGAIEDADRSFTGLGLRLDIDNESDLHSVSEDFKLPVLHAFEALVTSFIRCMSPVIRRVKHRQEDVGLASSRSARSGAPVWGANDEGAVPPAVRNDVAELFEFIGVLYTCLPADEGLKFWEPEPDASEGKLFVFLRWATESRERTLVSAALDMLAGISKGPSSSELTYNFLASGQNGDRGHGGILAGGGNVFSWTTLFNALAYWTETLPNPNVHHHSQGLNVPGRWQQPTFQNAEALMLGAFIHLMRIIVKYSPAARVALYSMPGFRVIPTLVALLQHGIQLEVKGTIIDALAAFCEPGAGVQGVEICKNIWACLERAELINLRSGGGLAIRGLENELEGVETPAQRYPATIPFLRLLNALIHTPKSISPQQMLVEYEPLETIPEGLGQPTRLGGIGPYVRFVVDTILLRAKDREFLDPSDKWKMIEGSMGFVERCLASYNLQSLLSLNEESINKNPDILKAYHMHPGYDLLTQLLTDTPLRREIVDFIYQGVDALENKTIRNPYFEKVLLRVLRIVHYILEVQDLFIELLLPLKAQLDAAAGRMDFLASSIVSFDQMLNWSPTIIIKIAACTLYAELAETKLLAVKIITLLSESSVFTAVDQVAPNSKRRLNRLAVVFDRNEDSNIISDGFMILLQQDSREDMSPPPEIVDMSIGAGAPLASASLDLTYAIRLAVLHLFLQNTLPDKPAPNVAHSLLGFQPDPSQHNQLTIQDPQAANSRRTCFHVILDLLNTGVPRQGIGSASPNMPTLLITQPTLAERCYRFIHQLCSHRTTSSVVMRYLRTREDFFARHLSVLPFRVPQNVTGSNGFVLYGDMTHVATTNAALLSFLRLRAWLLESVALELHVLTEMGQPQRASRLLMLLFGSGADLYEQENTLSGLLDPFSPGQSLIRMIELFQSLDFRWQDAIPVDQDIQPRLFTSLDVSSCLRVDETGCEIFDVNALLSLMYQHRQKIQVHGLISNAQAQEQLKNETKYILTSCTVENNRRQVQHAKGIGFESWKQLLDICLAKGFHRLPQDRRESILFDLLQILPPAIQSDALDPSTAVILAEALLSLVTKLRSDRQHQQILQSTFDDSFAPTLPVDRLRTLLRSTLECLAASGRAELIRGNLYAALVNYLHLVEDARNIRGFGKLDTSDDISASNMFSSSSSTSQDDLSSNLSEGNSFVFGRSRPKRSELEASTLTIINKDVDTLISVVSTDAIDGTEVWKTVSFTLLDSLVGLSRLEKPHRVLGLLARKGYLSNFVQSIRDSDVDLQQILRPDPDNLNSLYVYEAKLALLVRIAQTQQGAQKLVDSRIFQTLAQCDFIDTRPEADQSFLDQDSFLPSAIHRYHQLVLPALELVNGIVATLGASSAATKQAHDFLLAHRETFLILLRDHSAVPSYAQIREIHLLISLCSYVTSQVAKADLRSPASGFGGIHTAILALAAKCLHNGQWQLKLAPANDTERGEASVLAPGYGRNNISLFIVKVHQAVELLHEVLWVYLEAASASGAEEDSFAPVFTPVGVANRPDEPSSQINAPAPTISDSIDALAHVVNDLAKVLNEVTDITTKLTNKGSLSLEEIDQIARSSGAEHTEDLDIMQRRLLAYKELDKAREDRVNVVLRRLHSLEVLLLVIWRHVNYYGNSSGPSLGRSGGSGQLGRRSVLNQDESGALMEHIRRGLRPIISRLNGMRLPADVVGVDHRSREGFIEMMCRVILSAVSEDREASDATLVNDDIHGLGSW